MLSSHCVSLQLSSRNRTNPLQQTLARTNDIVAKGGAPAQTPQRCSRLVGTARRPPAVAARRASQARACCPNPIRWSRPVLKQAQRESTGTAPPRPFLAASATMSSKTACGTAPASATAPSCTKPSRTPPSARCPSSTNRGSTTSRVPSCTSARGSTKPGCRIPLRTSATSVRCFKDSHAMRMECRGAKSTHRQDASIVSWGEYGCCKRSS